MCCADANSPATPGDALPVPVESEIEIRQVFEAVDFGAEYTPELRAQEDRQRAEIEKRAKSGGR